MNINSTPARTDRQEVSSEEKRPEIPTIELKNEARSKLIFIHSVLCLCTFLVGLDFNLIAVAVLVITTEFNSNRDVGWYGAAFQLGLCTTQTLSGKIFILFSKKYTYLFYLALFEVGSLLCALSPSSKAFIVGRVIAGVGASGIFAGGFAILIAIVLLYKRSTFTGIINPTFPIASIIGPIIGGALLKRLKSFDCIGFVLFAGALYVGDNALIPPRVFNAHRNFQTVLGVGPLENGTLYLPTNPFLLFAEGSASLEGLGYSLATTMVHIALQSSMPKDIVPISSSTLLTFISISCSVFLALGQLVFQNRLLSNLLPFYLTAAAPVISFFLVCGCQ
ncbi:major facilitator superfamily domain-containing protein [Xylariaceae sp. FL0662B]|nr:major facilitator superfamily domain-containing protein [Xylariaceae sp. FL0662B]